MDRIRSSYLHRSRRPATVPGTVDYSDPRWAYTPRAVWGEGEDTSDEPTVDTWADAELLQHYRDMLAIVLYDGLWPMDGDGEAPPAAMANTHRDTAVMR